MIRPEHHSFLSSLVVPQGYYCDFVRIFQSVFSFPAVCLLPFGQSVCRTLYCYLRVTLFTRCSVLACVRVFLFSCCRGHHFASKHPDWCRGVELKNTDWESYGKLEIKQTCGGEAGNYTLSPTPQMSVKWITTQSNLRVSQCIVNKISASLSK